jgi:hypothetical protein
VGGQLPKLLDRDFVIGYFLPALTFVAASLGLFTAFPEAFAVQALLADASFLLDPKSYEPAPLSFLHLSRS